jgi:lipocalin
MRTIRLTRQKDEWVIQYDPEARTLTVGGPSPEASQLHRWLTTPRPIIDSTGSMIVVAPAQGWTHMKQAVETDLYGEFMMRAAFK